MAHTEPPLDGGPLVCVAVRDQKDWVDEQLVCDRAPTGTSVLRLLLCRAAARGLGGGLGGGRADGDRADALDQLGHLVDALGVAVGRRLHGAQRGHPPDHVWVRDERAAQR